MEKNISRYGEIDSCEFIQGWFEQTLPQINSPILLAFIDVDLEASLYTCVKHIWPHLVDEGGFIFIDEMDSTDYCSLFYSESNFSLIILIVGDSYNVVSDRFFQMEC